MLHSGKWSRMGQAEQSVQQVGSLSDSTQTKDWGQLPDVDRPSIETLLPEIPGYKRVEDLLKQM